MQSSGPDCAWVCSVSPLDSYERRPVDARIQREMDMMLHSFLARNPALKAARRPPGPHADTLAVPAERMNRGPNGGVRRSRKYPYCASRRENVLRKFYPLVPWWRSTTPCAKPTNRLIAPGTNSTSQQRGNVDLRWPQHVLWGTPSSIEEARSMSSHLSQPNKPSLSYV